MSKQYSVRECLHGYTDEALAFICERWQLAAKSKQSRLRAIENVLEDPLHVHRMLKGLDGRVLRLLRLAAGHGSIRATDLQRVPGLIGVGAATEYVSEATRLGLLLACPEGKTGAFSFVELNKKWHADEPSVILTVPELVKRLLPPPSPIGIILTPSESTPCEVYSSTGEVATLVILETLRIIDLITPRETSAGTLHKSDEARANELGRESNLPGEAIGLALMTLRELGFVDLRDGHLVTTTAVETWLEKSSPERVRDMYIALLRAQDVPDLKLFFPQLYESLDKHLPKGSLRRTYHRALLGVLLSELKPNAWYEVRTLVNALRTLDANVLFLEERWRGIQSNVHEMNASWRDRQWQMREERLFVWMLTRLLRDMGIVDVADNDTLVRLGPVGRYALGIDGVPEEDTERDIISGSIVVQPDFEVIAYQDRCPPKVRRKLDVFCERLRSGIVTTYRLSQQSVYRGVRHGTTAQEFLALLSRCSKHPLPANIRDQLGIWERKAEVIGIRTNCHVVECLLPSDAEQLAKRYVGAKRIGDRYVFVPSAHVDETLPRIEYGHERTPAMQQDDGLQLRLPWKKCDLFARRSLDGLGELITEPNGDLILKLSREKLKRSGDWGLVAAHIESLTEKPLASRYRMALRAWSGDLGSSITRSAVLVRFEDADTCAALAELPELAPHIEGRLGLFVLVIRQGHIGQFKKKLKKINIAVAVGDDMCDPQPPEVWAEPWVERMKSQIHQASPEEEAPAAKNRALKRYEKALPSYSPRIISEILTDAISRRRPVLIEYQAAWSSEPTVRRVDPVTLDTSGAAPTLSGFCHMHNGPRTFKLRKVVGVRVLESESF